jgi:polyphosphate glucokinase
MGTRSPAAPARDGPTGLVTLAIDVGGNGLKVAVLGAAGEMLSERVRVETPRPAHPDQLVATLRELARPLPAYDRVSVGFPGMVRGGRVLTAPNLVRHRGRRGRVSAKAAAAWEGFDLAGVLSTALGAPTKVVNDASMQGAAVVSGHGLEWVVTLGTGFGTALFWDGKPTPHLELSHHPFHKGRTYDEYLGDAARHAVGNRRWNKRVLQAIEALDRLSYFDRVYVGGGNSRHVTIDLGPKARLVDNTAGILGGIRVWDSEPAGTG